MSRKKDKTDKKDFAKTESEREREREGQRERDTRERYERKRDRERDNEQKTEPGRIRSKSPRTWPQQVGDFNRGGKTKSEREMTNRR